MLGPYVTKGVRRPRRNRRGFAQLVDARKKLKEECRTEDVWR